MSIASGAAAMVCVGGSVAVSGVLTNAPFYSAEAIRYAVACAILVVIARRTGRPILRPAGAELAWLGAVALTGLVIFNVALAPAGGVAMRPSASR